MFSIIQYSMYNFFYVAEDGTSYRSGIVDRGGMSPATPYGGVPRGGIPSYIVFLGGSI